MTVNSILYSDDDDVVFLEKYQDLKVERSYKWYIDYARIIKLINSYI